MSEQVWRGMRTIGRSRSLSRSLEATKFGCVGRSACLYRAKSNIPDAAFPGSHVLCRICAELCAPSARNESPNRCSSGVSNTASWTGSGSNMSDIAVIVPGQRNHA